jgi:hypothetical protein
MTMSVALKVRETTLLLQEFPVVLILGAAVQRERPVRLYRKTPVAFEGDWISLDLSAHGMPIESSSRPSRSDDLMIEGLAFTDHYASVDLAGRGGGAQ